MIRGDHWYAQSETCTECGNPLGDPVHFQRCLSAWTLQGVGFAFCRDPLGHEYPHHLVNWDGRVFLAHEDGTTEETDEVIPRGRGIG